MEKILSQEEYKKYFFQGEEYVKREYYVGFIADRLFCEFGLKYNEKAKFWYSEWSNDQRLVVKIYNPKGNHDLLMWGYNYNFIPSITRNGTFSWHRTDNAFEIHVSDSWYNHIEYKRDKEWGLSEREYGNPQLCPVFQYEIPQYTSDLDFAINYVYEVVERNIPLIQEWLTNIKTINDAIVFWDKEILKATPWTKRHDYYIKAFLHAYQNDLEAALEAMKASYDYGDIPQSVIEKLYQTPTK